MSGHNRREFVIATTAAFSAASFATAGAQDAEKIDISRIGKTPHTKFAVNVEMWWKQMPFLDRIRRTAEYGFPAFEMWPYENKDLGALTKLKEKLGIHVSSLGVKQHK